MAKTNSQQHGLLIGRLSVAFGFTTPSPEASAFRAGCKDGLEQGFKLRTGMTYQDERCQWAYDAGTHVGALLAVRPF